MNDIIVFLKQPWPWYVGGPIIALVMFLMLFFGKRFGISSNLKNLCSALGAGKSCEFFDYDWKAQTWNLVFALGLVLGGGFAAYFLSNNDPIQISEATTASLTAMGIENEGGLVPKSVFSVDQLVTVRGIVMMVVGGFLIGFGTRYADGCTSGHALSGLSNLQLPSLIAVVGFFIGGLVTTHFLLPYLLAL